MKPVSTVIKLQNIIKHLAISFSITSKSSTKVKELVHDNISMNVFLKFTE